MMSMVLLRGGRNLLGGRSRRYEYYAFVSVTSVTQRLESENLWGAKKNDRAAICQ